MRVDSPSISTDGTEMYLARPRPCVFCLDGTHAAYHARTRIGWFDVCEPHGKKLGDLKLGWSEGQRIVVEATLPKEGT